MEQSSSIHYMVYLFVQITPLLVTSKFIYILLNILKNLYLQKYWRLSFLQFRYYPCCGQENWFQNWSAEDFSVDKRWTPTLSIAQNTLHELMNVLFYINGRNCTSCSESIGLGNWVEGTKIPPRGPKSSKKSPQHFCSPELLSSRQKWFCIIELEMNTDIFWPNGLAIPLFLVSGIRA